MSKIKSFKGLLRRSKGGGVPKVKKRAIVSKIAIQVKLTASEKLLRDYYYYFVVHSLYNK